MIIDLLENNVEGTDYYSFRVTNPRISVNFDVKGISNQDYAAAQPLRGIMLLCKNSFDEIWHNVNLYVAANQDITIDLSVFLDKHEIIDVMIYGPLYSKLTKLLVSCEDGIITNPEINNDVLLIGGKDTFGRACTTTAFKFSNILQRKNKRYMQSLCYDEDNYTGLIKKYLQKNSISSEIVILELNNHTDKQKMRDIIESLKFKYLFIWYYNFDDEAFFNEIIQDNDVTFLNSQKDLSECEWKTHAYCCPINHFDEEYFDEFCTINNELLNDSGNIFIYRIIQQFFDGVLK